MPESKNDHTIAIPGGLNTFTAELVVEFAEALAAKLRSAEIKYGYDDGWRTQDWGGQCRADLYCHATKGDPLDVTVFAAFMWKRGWSTSLGLDADKQILALARQPHIPTPAR